MEQTWHILYEDNHIIVVFKPAGVLVQGDETGDTPLVEMVREYIREHYQKPGNVFCGVVHRLDRPVSGVVVFAKTSKALERLNRAFQEHEIEKRYLAIVEQRPAELKGRLEHYLLKDHERNIVKATNKQRNNQSKKAELEYNLLGGVGNHYLLEVHPLTGRPHQIRVQLSSMGCPIRGDVKYGATRTNADGSIHLHAYQLTITHPVRKEEMTFTAAPPKEQLWNEFKNVIPDPQTAILSNSEFSEEE